MKFLFPFAIVVLVLFTACSQTPAPPARPPATQPLVPTTNAAATETAVTVRVLSTLTASAPQPTVSAPTHAATVTPPPLPTQVVAATNAPTIAPTHPPPTLSLVLSPSVTPIPVLPTRPAAAAPTKPPQPTAVQVSQEVLRGKIMFKSTRSNGKYPHNFQYFVMDADGSNVAPLNKGAAEALYKQLKPLEGYSPDKQFLVLGEKTCASNAKCDLYVGAPETIQNRSQGVWTPSGPRWYRADNPVWSPDSSWIAFVWNRDNDRTKNIFKGMPFVSNQDFKRLTDFGGRRDTKDPTYSPDGTQLAFATQDGARWQIWILNALAENPTDANAHNLSNSEFDDWDPLWIK